MYVRSYVCKLIEQCAAVNIKSSGSVATLCPKITTYKAWGAETSTSLNQLTHYMLGMPRYRIFYVICYG